MPTKSAVICIVLFDRFVNFNKEISKFDHFVDRLFYNIYSWIDFTFFANFV